MTRLESQDNPVPLTPLEKSLFNTLRKFDHDLGQALNPPAAPAPPPPP
jgi:hypothetical protein